ncbi:MAG TPA: PBP1A family penicillin-binding protein [Pyrinomonadaceae bacterium]|nr:PBP1A family penicillin-binding protein [Pyrinomonadaceae bacterium]
MAREARRIVTREVETVEAKKNGFWRYMWLPTALLLALSAGSLTGVLASYYLNNSRYATEVSALATYRPPQVTTIYADDGETILAEFALEKRIPIKEQDIPKNVENALLAVEDFRYYKHIGIDPYRIGGVFVKFARTGKMEGASTITQQLAKNLFLYRDQTLTRKATEWMMALEMERLYTKRQILEMYMNYVFLGAGSYGFEAGARTYFGKSLKDLSLEEAALLAAIPKSPEYSPTRNMEKAKMRRDIVLDQMAKYFPDDYSQSEINAAKSRPIKLADTAYYQSLPKSTAWDYPVEEVRKYLEEKYTTRVAQGGLKVYTTINVDAQKIATKAVREGLRQYDRNRKWRSEYQNILLDENNQPITDRKEIEEKLKAFKHADWYGDEYAKGEFIKGLVMEVDPVKDEATIRFGRNTTAIVTAKEMGKSGKKPKDELKVGFLPEFEIKEAGEDSGILQVQLSQVPEVQASIVSLNARTGEIAAMVGGYDYHTNRFNNSTQGLRQTGSAYKPFIYTAAVEWGMTPEMMVSGAPVKRGDWMPHNYDGSLSHPNVPLKSALAKSYNLAAVHLLEQVGVQTGAQMVRRFGITNPMAPSLASALGASEASLLEMVSAYSAFPNKGVRITPHLIRKVYSRDGSILEEWKETTSRVTSEYVALTMVDIMRGVTGAGGTAPGASAAGHELAGKTGTVNDQTDVWFIGYTPTYVTGVWMGNPERKQSLGGNMTGGVGALPYFNTFMNVFMKDKPKDKFPEPPPVPSEIKALSEQRKREEQEKLEKAEQEGAKLGAVINTSARNRRGDRTESTDPEAPSTEIPATIDPTDTLKPDNAAAPKPVGDDVPKPPVKPAVAATPVKKAEPPAEKPQNEAPKRKGKKGDGDQ